MMLSAPGKSAQPRKPVSPESLFQRKRRVHTPTLLQMEAVECGAAALGIVLGYYGRYVPLEELRITCGVSRDGSKASSIVKAARIFGLKAAGYKKEPAQLEALPLPLIVFWNFNHFVVVEGFGSGKVYLNDPASGPRRVTAEEFDQSFTGVVLTFEPTDQFERGGSRSTLWQSLRARLSGLQSALLFVLLVSLALVVPGIIIPTFTQVFVDSYLINGNTGWLAMLLAAMGATALLNAVLTWLQLHYLLRLETRLALSTSSRFVWHVLRLPLEFFSQRHAGEIAGRVGINDRVAELLSGRLASTALNVITIVFYALVMFWYDVVLTLIGISIVTLNIVALQFVSRKRVDNNQQVLQEQGKLVGAAAGGLQSIETLKADANEGDLFARLTGYHARAVRAEQKLAIYSYMLSVIPVTLTIINTAVILAVGSLRVIDGSMTMGMLVAFMGLMTAFTAPVTMLVNLGGLLQETEGDMKRLDDVLRYPIDPLVRSDTASGSNGSTPPAATSTTSTNGDAAPAAIRRTSKLTGKLELRNVTFGYSKVGAPLIENFNLSVKPGSRVALVGGSGSGKSTLARLVTGLYRPWSGDILFDNMTRSAVDRRVLTNSLAVVDQEIFLFEGTVRENLTLWDTSVREAHIIQAARDAAIHDEIDMRPGGYDSLVAEAGTNFSGGQQQRLEIARALVSNPTILVLDEATSALDPATEVEIDNHLRRRGCTCLIVAHRLSTIRDCDEIIVLDQGQIVQRGTHQELMRSGGQYAELVGAEVQKTRRYLDF